MTKGDEQTEPYKNRAEDGRRDHKLVEAARNVERT
jgi:hypothetical protein